MEIAYRLTPELRKKLKNPIGTLILGSFDETMNRVREIAAQKKDMIMISVGDTVTRNLLQNDLIPKISIIDNVAMRRKVEPIVQFSERIIRVQNPQGTITTEAIEAIRNSFMTNGNVRIIVNGEEDLLTLIAVRYAPEGSMIVYGQPHEGIVVIDSSQKKKKEIETILRAMENSGKAK